MKLNGKIALLLVVLLPLSFYLYFEIKKNQTGLRLKKLPVLSETTLPDFKLIAHTGDTVTRHDVEGKILVSDFFFTKCRGICPQMSRSMRNLQEYFLRNSNLQSPIILLSHTVDPANDSVPVLNEYAQLYGADQKLWLLVTGDKKQLYDLAINFYKLPALETPNDTLNPFTHSERFTLVDKAGHIRGYYDGTDSASVKQLMKDVVDLDLSYRVQNP
ncbi:MAG TPA: SCO family protein [Chitinophagales bacterium]|nr:SCO family protein [Chitinophagales bacterium]